MVHTRNALLSKLVRSFHRKFCMHRDKQQGSCHDPNNFALLSSIDGVKAGQVSRSEQRCFALIDRWCQGWPKPLTRAGPVRSCSCWRAVTTTTTGALSTKALTAVSRLAIGSLAWLQTVGASARWRVSSRLLPSPPTSQQPERGGPSFYARRRPTDLGEKPLNPDKSGNGSIASRGAPAPWLCEP